MKIFLATSFSNKVLQDGTVELQYRAEIEKIISTIEKLGHVTFCALKEEGWRLNNISPTYGFDKDIKEIRQCDLFAVLIRNNPPSAGVEFELGVAYQLNRKIVIFYQEKDLPIPYINQGLLNKGEVISYSYSHLSDIPHLLEQYLNK